MDLIYFLSNLVNFLGIFTSKKKFMLLEQLIETNNLTFMTVLEKFYFTFSVVKMAENELQGSLQSMISCISSNKLKAWGVSDYYSKLQL